MREIEIKIAVDDPAEARRRLGGAGLVALSPRIFEDNRVYDDADGSLAAAHRLLRLRSAGGRHTLTFKRPESGPGSGSDSGRYKVRIEHEVEVSDPDEMHAILASLGYRVAYRYQKYRQTYALGRVEIDLDETPIGTFMELEGPPEEIDRLAAALGYGPEDYITRTYRDLFVEHRAGSTAGDMVFDAGR
ncbi:MAG: class IV adenylate cyclase [Acidobacteriota bacterium]